ncbi:MAG: nitroreductase family protein [Bacteroidota bacterium]
MKLSEAIINRRSIRKYTSEPVGDDTIQKILEAGFYAPSARNTQSNEFIVIRSKEILQKLSEAHPYGKMLPAAAFAVVVCGSREREEHESYLNTNGCAAMQNMLLMAHSLGLGAVWLGVYPRTDRMNGIASVLNIPSGFMPVQMFAAGRPAEERPHPDRVHPDRIHRDGW